MHPNPARREDETARVGVVGPEQARLVPTVSGMVTASASVMMLAAVSVLLLIPTVFYVIPIPPDADAATLCLPGLGPLQRFREGLQGEREERTYIHEGVHADQCRKFGATWYAQRTVSPEGRLTMEAQAFCAEVAVLSRRGADAQRLLDWTVETLATEYLEDGSLARQDIALAVDGACAGVTEG